MFACDSAATARASRSKRCRSALGASVFTATRRASSRSSASHTALIAPRPSGSSRRYRPAISSSLIGRDYRDRRDRPPDDRRSARARARARPAAAGRGRAGRGRCGACARRGRQSRGSTCRRFRARRWTGTPSVPPTRRGRSPSRASRRPDIPSDAPLGAGQAITISTGAVVPDGADAVVPVERTRARRRVGATSSASSPARTCVRAAATSRRATPSSLPAPRAARRSSARSPRPGSRRFGARVARASPCSRPAVSCAVPASRSGRARSTSRTRVMLAAQLRRAGADAEVHGAVADDADATRAALERGLDADVLLTSGGVSVGEHDLVRGLLAELGVVEVFWRVAVKPGKPVAFSTRGSTLVFGLARQPGLVVRRLRAVRPPRTRRAAGRAPIRVPRSCPAVSTCSLQRNAGRDELVRARIDDGGLVHAAARSGVAHDRARRATRLRSCSCRAATASSPPAPPSAGCRFDGVGLRRRSA